MKKTITKIIYLVLIYSILLIFIYIICKYLNILVFSSIKPFLLDCEQITKNKTLFEITFSGINLLFKNSKEILFENDHSFVDTLSTCEIELWEDKSNKEYIEESSTLTSDIDSLKIIPNYINRPVAIDIQDIVENICRKPEKISFNVNIPLYKENINVEDIVNDINEPKSVKKSFTDLITSKPIIFFSVLSGIFVAVVFWSDIPILSAIPKLIWIPTYDFFLPGFWSTTKGEYLYFCFFYETNYPMYMRISEVLFNYIASQGVKNSLPWLAQAGADIFNHLKNNGMRSPSNSEELNNVATLIFKELTSKIPNGDLFIPHFDEFFICFSILLYS